MQESTREKPEGMEVEDVALIPWEHERIMLIEHYNIIQQLIHEGR
jgi:hypothetical protein